MHAGQRPRRAPRRKSSWRAPHPPQRLLEGNQRATLTTVRPYHAALYSRGRRSSPSAASLTERLSTGFARTLRAGASPHALGVQVLDRDHLVLVDESMTEPMEVLAPALGDARKQARDAGPGAPLTLPNRSGGSSASMLTRMLRRLRHEHQRGKVCIFTSWLPRPGTSSTFCGAKRS